MKKTPKSDVLFNFGNQKIADEKKDDFMDTHHHISECLIFLVFFQIAHKCYISWRDLDRDLESETTDLLLRRLSWTAVGYPLAKGSSHVANWATENDDYSF